MHDSKVAIELLSGVNITGSNILGDKAYGTAAIRNYITERDPNKFCVKPNKALSISQGLS